MVLVIGERHVPYGIIARMQFLYKGGEPRVGYQIVLHVFEKQ